MDLNAKIFLKINSLVGKSKLLDSFGRAGAEWVIIAMIAWYIGATFVDRMPDKTKVFWSLVFLFGAWCVGWLINLGLAVSVREPRPYVSYPYIKFLFKPLMSWKSFPSDHSFSAFLVFFMACIFNLPGAWALGVMAVWVVWGRVYAGVHYPLDILGGAVVAGFVATISYYAVRLVA
ncbi:phosphatase PAP2 family protein [Patescibacteria group bacterium]|nr:phosphatase PAP2 family protein [Patescibacteria group bacterium]